MTWRQKRLMRLEKDVVGGDLNPASHALQIIPTAFIPQIDNLCGREHGAKPFEFACLEWADRLTGQAQRLPNGLQRTSHHHQCSHRARPEAVEIPAAHEVHEFNLAEKVQQILAEQIDPTTVG
jgi:hypothetical protein